MPRTHSDVLFETLQGKTVWAVSLNRDKSEVKFITDGGCYTLLHVSECCETVELVDVVGQWRDLLDTPLRMAAVATQEGVKVGLGAEGNDSLSFTWSFYKLGTVKGYVTLRWYGCSAGNYSERVDCLYSPLAYEGATQPLNGELVF